MQTKEFYAIVSEYKNIFNSEDYIVRGKNKFKYKELILEITPSKYGWDEQHGGDFYIRGLDTRYFDQLGNIDSFADTFLVPGSLVLASPEYDNYLKSVEEKIPRPLGRSLVVPYYDADDLNVFLTNFLEDILQYGRSWYDSRDAPTEDMVLGPNRMGRSAK